MPRRGIVQPVVEEAAGTLAADAEDVHDGLIVSGEIPMGAPHLALVRQRDHGSASVVKV